MDEITYTKDVKKFHKAWFNQSSGQINITTYSNCDVRFDYEDDICEITLEKDENILDVHLVYIIRQAQKKFKQKIPRESIETFLLKYFNKLRSTKDFDPGFERI